MNFLIEKKFIEIEGRNYLDSCIEKSKLNFECKLKFKFRNNFHSNIIFGKEFFKSFYTLIDLKNNKIGFIKSKNQFNPLILQKNNLEQNKNFGNNSLEKGFILFILLIIPFCFYFYKLVVSKNIAIDEEKLSIGLGTFFLINFAGLIGYLCYIHDRK